MTASFKHTGFFAFRVPALPLGTLTEWSQGTQAATCPPSDLADALMHDRTLLQERLATLVRRPAVRAALGVASPDLLAAMDEDISDPAVEASAIRYISRMASRPPPFGLFAACGVGEISDRTQLTVPEPSTWRRHTRLDGDYLDRVVRDRATELRPRLTFAPNDSMYVIGGRRRYVQSRLDGVERTHHLAEISNSTHLQRALAASPAQPVEIAAAVAEGGIELERAQQYVDELIEAQVLVPELAVTLTGLPPLDALIADLAAVGDDDTAAILTVVRDELAAIDAEGTTADLEGHNKVAELLRGLPAPDGRARLLQVDSTIPSCDATLASSTVDDVVRGVELLRRIAPARQQNELDLFREAFQERYEEREVPLLEALDGDLGAGFGSGAGDPAPLLKDLPRPPADRQVAMGRREQQLLTILLRGLHEVVLTSDDLAALSNDNPVTLPVGASAMGSLARTADGPRIIVNFVGGAPGAGLLGRFCHADHVLEAHVRAHLRAEEAPDVLHAEIVHLPSGLTSNILARPVLRDYEIEWLGRSGAPADRRIAASDLMVSVRNGRFVLRSQRLDRQVLPWLTTAHNWSRRSPAVYRFLAAIQHQGTSSASWSWGPFEQAPFTPRVRHGRLVLALARWGATAPELRALDVKDPVARWQTVQEWRQRRDLPRWICLVDDDNKLAIDLDNVLSVDTFVRLVRNREAALLEELYPGPEDLVAEGPDGKRALELIIPLVNTGPVAPGALPARPSSTVRRTFPPGSEWTTLKLYTGSATADVLLRGSIGPLAAALIEQGDADCWFFLRYGDPRSHLRVRFHGSARPIQEALQRPASDALDAGLAHDVQFATYQREIERYGGPDATLVAERLFHADSDATITLLGMFERGDRGLDERWRIGLLGSYVLLRDLGLSDEQCAAHARRQREAFEREFHADAPLRKAVAARVRKEQPSVEELLSPGEDHPLFAGAAVLGQRSERVRPLVAELLTLQASGHLELPLETLASSYVHMWLDRLCRTENRFHEYVIYALLARALEARCARKTR
jgi:thiopeptide-type bacteriocin biosynthesis protein